ncbi:MAG: hypothetical protein IPF53_08780 [Blastocatellia bacterium]|nr:hypothetical protein [Blastocatellia bacterium]
MIARWGDELLRDPYYSPNLTLVHEDFSVDVTKPDGVRAVAGTGRRKVSRSRLAETTSRR